MLGLCVVLSTKTDFKGDEVGFLSFNEKYYNQRLNELENKALTSSDIYETKQLLKVLEDLYDEGYTNLNNHMENKFSCLTRLRNLLKRFGTSPFPIIRREIPQINYSAKSYALDSVIDKLIASAKKIDASSISSFLVSIYQYSEWIGYEEGTAYIFLLRDTLLPYIFFRNKNRRSIHAWLINRNFLKDITRINEIDDNFRLPIYEALESGKVSFDIFCSFCRVRTLSTLNEHEKLKDVLTDLLNSISEDRIVVVESGYAGTIPITLKALDNRVDFRMYTTAPFLYETYKDRIFCYKYEDLRKFETLIAQDVLLKYSSYSKGKFYVNITNNDAVLNESLKEIKLFLS